MSLWNAQGPAYAPGSKLEANTVEYDFSELVGEGGGFMENIYFEAANERPLMMG